MRTLFLALCTLSLPLFAADDGWTQLFNGKDMTGWQTNENPQTFTVKDGALVAHGPRSHCFYVGDFHDHTFINYELMVDIMTLPGSNGGVYIATAMQGPGWPQKGFEVQVNNTYRGDPRRTGSLYEVQDVHDVVAPDNKWFTEDITVMNDNIKVKVDGKQVVDWTQPSDWKGTSDFPDRRVGPGTIAMQAHDPGSTVYYKNIRIKVLP